MKLRTIGWVLAFVAAAIVGAIGDNMYMQARLEAQLGSCPATVQVLQDALDNSAVLKEQLTEWFVATDEQTKPLRLTSFTVSQKGEEKRWVGAAVEKDLLLSPIGRIVGRVVGEAGP
ncbi:MAG: hypothetical protein HYV13_03145 [Candidatus Doudnabacteria bacterium]|nr:hypothetical protein [Candidatus Doudnabacteria bacterium]